MARFHLEAGHTHTCHSPGVFPQGRVARCRYPQASMLSLDRWTPVTQDRRMDTTPTQSAVPPLTSGLTLCDDGRVRPTWASHDELLRTYYDTEWGLPVHDEAGVFERLVLEGFQAGLSWRTVLAKREAFREAFEGLIPDRVAAFTTDDVDRLLSAPGIIRNRRKIEAAIANARATVAIRTNTDTTDGPSHLGELVWSYRPAHDPRPRSQDEVPTQLPESVALAADLKSRGFRFVGPTTMLALMAAIGIVNTDIVGTHRRPR